MKQRNKCTDRLKSLDAFGYPINLTYKESLTY